MTATTTSESSSTRRRGIIVFVPLAVFLGLAALFLIRLGAGDTSRIPSALIGQPAPQTILPPVAGLERDGKPVPGLEAETFKGAVTVLNVWASWCVPCHDEAPLLVKLAADKRIRVVGINYKDSRTTRGASSPATAIRSPPTASTSTAAPRSNGASMACRKPSWSAATAASPTS